MGQNGKPARLGWTAAKVVPERNQNDVDLLSGFCRSWHKLQVELQHQILERMRGLGMLPVREKMHKLQPAISSFFQVLPGFAGQVPDAFVQRYPGASFTKQTWKPFKASNLSGVYMLRLS